MIIYNEIISDMDLYVSIKRFGISAEEVMEMKNFQRQVFEEKEGAIDGDENGNVGSKDRVNGLWAVMNSPLSVMLIGFIITTIFGVFLVPKFEEWYNKETIRLAKMNEDIIRIQDIRSRLIMARYNADDEFLKDVSHSISRLIYSYQSAVISLLAMDKKYLTDKLIVQDIMTKCGYATNMYNDFSSKYRYYAYRMQYMFDEDFSNAFVGTNSDFMKKLEVTNNINISVVKLLGKMYDNIKDDEILILKGKEIDKDALEKRLEFVSFVCSQFVGALWIEFDKNNTKLAGITN